MGTPDQQAAEARRELEIAAWRAFRDAVLAHHLTPTRSTARRLARAYRGFVVAYVDDPKPFNVTPLRSRGSR